MKLSGCLAVLLLLATVSSVFGQQVRERKLEEGRFPYIRGAELGKPMNFDDEIELTRCWPLKLSGRVLAWLARAYRIDGRLLVKRCVEVAPAIYQDPGTKAGSQVDWWEEALLENGAVAVKPLRLPEESVFSSASFCNEFVGYWGFSGSDENITIIPTIYNLRFRSMVANKELEKADVETDYSGFLPRPRWNRTCSEATFDASVLERSTLKLNTKHSK